MKNIRHNYLYFYCSQKSTPCWNKNTTTVQTILSLHFAHKSSINNKTANIQETFLRHELNDKVKKH